MDVKHNNLIITYEDRLHPGEGVEDGDEESYENLCGDVVGLEGVLLEERCNEFTLNTFCRRNLSGLCRRGLIGGLSFIKFSCSIFCTLILAQKATKTQFCLYNFTNKIFLYSNKINITFHLP